MRNVKRYSTFCALPLITRDGIKRQVNMRRVLWFAALLALLTFGAAAVGAVTVMRQWRDMDAEGEW